MDAAGTAPSQAGPDCQTVSAEIHDRYTRQPQDLPWRGRTVRLVLTVRRCRCRHATCPRRTFAESFGPALVRHARRTAEVTALLLEIAETTGGEAGARAARRQGLQTSPDTLLRLLQVTTTEPTGPGPRVLGVDDLALRRRHSYATLLVNLETHRPIDLLRGREAEPLAAWLRHHPGTEIIVRDRSGAYADGARAGAPQAIQVADRFHRVQNASVALEEVLRSRHRQREVALIAAAETAPTPAVPARPPGVSRRRRETARAARHERWEQARRWRAEGWSISQIARELRASRGTIRRWLATPEPRNHVVRRSLGGLKSPLLQPYAAYLEARWQAGCTNVSQLYRELEAQGYRGSRTLLGEALQPWRPPRLPKSARRRRRTVSLRWLCLRPPAQLPADEQAVLTHALEANPDLARGYDLLQQFRAVFAEREVAHLDCWLAAAKTSDLAPFVALAHGIEQDRAAVDAALTLPWSNGRVAYCTSSPA